MDRMVKAKVNGADRYMGYSVGTMFQVSEKYGSVKDLLELISQDSPNGLAALQWIVKLMVNDAELDRRESGYAPLPLVEEVSACMHPLEYSELKQAAVLAINAGYIREVVDDSEVDLGLEELQAKKEAAGA